MPAPLRLAGAGGALPAYAIDGARIVYCDLRLAGAGGALPVWDRADLGLAAARMRSRGQPAADYRESGRGEGREGREGANTDLYPPQRYAQRGR